MAGPLLKTKLYVPKPRRERVSRQRLMDRLGRATESRLTLVSAPPGFGKTTLLADWIASAPPGDATFAWVSLDEGDNEPATFWSYVLAAVEGGASGTEWAAPAGPSPTQPTAVDDLLAAVIDAASTTTVDLVLVLDDYHVIGSREIHERMAFLIDHLPSNLHLVIASRTDPPLPLARLRARGDLVEIRAEDLRFRREEAAAFFEAITDLHLSAGDLEALETRTEGWIAALQLAALSMHGREDVHDFVAKFAGDHHYIVDYLVEEVLQRQPEDVRWFLLTTSILERMNGAICDAVTGGQGSEAMLRGLEAGNVFVVPLDDRREWYRYHHLFADVLRAHLVAAGNERARELHARASTWFEQHGETGEAIRHALQAEDLERAAGLIEIALPEMLQGRHDVTLRHWLEALPDELLRRRPVLATGYVSVLLNTGEVERVDALLDAAERGQEEASRVDVHNPLSTSATAYVDDVQFSELPGMIALYRAARAQIAGNVADTAVYAQQALERMADDAPLRGGALALLGLALWSKGELEEAARTYAEGIELVHRGGWVNDSSTIMLGDIRVAQGRLREARAAYEQALEGAARQGKSAPRGTADLHVGLSEILLEQGYLEGAEEHLAASRALGDAAALPENRHRWYRAMAAVKLAEDAPGEALDLLQQAEGLYAPGFSPDVRPIAATRARVWIRQGRIDDASEWVRQRGLTARDELSYLREFEHVTLARLLVARIWGGADDDGSAQAVELFDRLARSAEAGGRIGTLIEVLALRALALQAGGDQASALSSLERALALAEPEGYVRVFLDEGPAMAALLATAAKRSVESYAHSLLSRERGSASSTQRQAIQHELSEREIGVLRLLATELSGPDIARELVVSLNTLRTHTKSIYTKLGVTSRRAAVNRAQALGLL